MLWLVFPAYNEKVNLVSFLPDLNNFLRGKIENYKILIIDDGSSDSTKNIGECFKKPLPIKVISHEINKGVGEVFKTAFSALAVECDENDFAIILEADGTSDYSLIPRIAESLKRGNDIVIASRYIKGGAYRNFPLKRYLVSFVGNVILRFFFGKKISDYTIFYRGYRIGIIKEALSRYKNNFITSDTFLANTEMLINLAELTDKIDEVPFVYCYDMKKGRSKMPLARTLLDYLKFLAAKLFYRSP